MGEVWGGLLRTPLPLKLCPDLKAFNSHSRQKDAFDSERSLIKLNKNRLSRLQWCLRTA